MTEPVSPFGENDNEALDREASRSDTTSNASVLYLRGGSTVVRVLPVREGKGMYFREYREHYLSVDNKSVYLTCTEDENCAVCEESDRLASLGDEHAMELASSMDARLQFLFNVIVLQTPPMENAPEVGQVYAMKAPVTVKSAIVKMDRDEAGDWYDVTSPFHGVNLRITKEGRGKTGTKYHVLPSGGRTNIVDFLASVGVNKTLEQIHAEMLDLDSVFPSRSYEEAKKLVQRAGRRQQRLQRPPQEVPISAPTTQAPPPTPPSAPSFPTTPPKAPPPPPRPEE